MWTLFFDGSKSLEGVGIACVLRYPKCNKILISFKHEFQCTNNIVDYEALLQVLKNILDLKEKKIKVFGDSEICRLS